MTWVRGRFYQAGVLAGSSLGEYLPFQYTMGVQVG